jgi:hypothetical protein
MLTGDLPKVDQAAAETIAAIVVTGLFRPDLKCFVLAVSYDFLKHGRLDMPRPSVAAWAAVLICFRRLMQTYSGSRHSRVVKEIPPTFVMPRRGQELDGTLNWPREADVSAALNRNRDLSQSAANKEGQNANDIQHYKRNSS